MVVAASGGRAASLRPGARDGISLRDLRAGPGGDDMSKWTPGEVKLLKRTLATARLEVALAAQRFSGQEITDGLAALKRRRARTTGARARRKLRPTAR